MKLSIDPETNQKVALKILKHSYVKKEFKSIQEEINCLCDLEHPNIVKIFDVQQDVEYKRANGKTTKETFLVLELAPNGELFDYVAETDYFGEPTCRYFMQKIISALDHTFKKGYAHRDLKP